jgi:hypothetical protein
MDERAAQLLLNSFPRYADSARWVQLRSVESGQTFPTGHFIKPCRAVVSEQVASTIRLSKDTREFFFVPPDPA